MDLPKSDLIDLCARFHGIECVMLGAFALECLGMERPTATLDVDLALRCPQPELHRRLSKTAWVQLAPQRWLSPAEVAFDLLPAGDTHQDAGFVEFPDGQRMSLVGMRHLWTQSVSLPGVPTQVASPACLFVLKIVAFRERPYEREKDLGDLCFILERFLDAEDDRRYLGPAADRGLYQEDAAAWWLGSELASFLEAAEASMVMEFIEEALRSERLAERLAVRAPQSWGRSTAVVHQRFGALGAGLLGATVTG